MSSPREIVRSFEMVLGVVQGVYEALVGGADIIAFSWGKVRGLL